MRSQSVCTSITAPSTSMLEVEFCGELHQLVGSERFTIGADALLELDVSSSLPCKLLELRTVQGAWFVEQLAGGAMVELADRDGVWSAMLQPGRPVPLVLGKHLLRIKARGYYEVALTLADPPYRRSCARRSSCSIASTPDALAARRRGPSVVAELPVVEGDVPASVSLTDEQRLLLVALAEPVLRKGPDALSEIPSSVEAAELLGWPVTKFNRKLDTVCARLSAAGLDGLHGGAGRPALNRRTRLVQLAVGTGLVDAEQLDLLEVVGPAA